MRLISGEVCWLSEKAIRAIHDVLIARTGGTPGILNSGMLESTLYKAKNIYYYENNSSVFKLAAAYGYGFIKNHCFIDGNKRVALASVAVFFKKNGYELNASETEAVKFFLELASTLETQDDSMERLTNWIENNTIGM